MKTIVMFMAIVGAFFWSSPASAEPTTHSNDKPLVFIYSLTEAANGGAYRDVVNHLHAINEGENPAEILQSLFVAVADVNAQHWNGYDVLEEMGVTRYELADAITAYFHTRIQDLGAITRGDRADEYARSMSDALFQLLAFYDETGDIPRGVSKREPIEGGVLKNLVYPEWSKTPAAPVGPPAEVAPPTRTR